MRTLLIILLLCSQLVWGQHRFSLVPVTALNSHRHELVCGTMDGRPLLVTNDRQDLINDYAWNTHYSFQLKVAERGKTYLDLSAPQRLLPFPGVRSEGTASYNPRDSTLYFSSAESYDDSRGNHLRMYTTRWNGRTWSSPQLVSLCTGTADYAHPWFDPGLGVLFFSSNRKGGFGGMDIWYSYRQGDDWTDPVNPGMLVNTSGHEVFPSVSRDDLFFASDGILPSRGYELFCCEKKAQWKSAIQLPDPLNSVGDDVMIVFLDENRGFVSSDRPGGKGGDDVYLFSRSRADLSSNPYTLELEVDGRLFPDASVRITNALQEILLEGKTDADGRLGVQSLPMAQSLRVAVSGVPPQSLAETILFLVDEYGNRVRELRLNEAGWVELELLPFNYSELELVPNMDQSWLSVSIAGQLTGKEGESWNSAGEPITIVDEDGEPVAVAFTGRGGTFRFDGLSPDLSYTFRLKNDSRAAHVVVFDEGQRIVLPVLDQEAIYSRLEGEEAIAIVNEFDQVVYVSAADLFVVNRIYYEFGKATLTGEAKQQLDKLAWLLDRNKGLSIEVMSHTDSRGSDADNLKLSQLRAESVLDYLTSKDIDRMRMVASGRGESRLLNDCRDGGVCSEEEHAINRRTEIRFISPAGR